MPTPFAIAARAAHTALLPISGGEITYQRGNDTETVDAVFGRTMFEAASFDGGITRHHSRDFLIAVDALPYGMPEKHDLIITDGRKYQVMRPDGGEDVWRWSDSFGQVVRVHTKYIGDVPAIAGAFSSAFSNAFEGGQ